MKIDLEGSVVLEAVEDAVELMRACMAAFGYQEEVEKIPGPTVAEIAAGNGDVHVGLAKFFCDDWDADMFLFAWLVMRGFRGPFAN